MKTVAFIPIKMNNERLPGKNTKCFSDGTPLVKLLSSKMVSLKGNGIDEVYIYCSNEEIMDYVGEGVTFLKRPQALDQKETKGRQIYEEFVKTVPADIYILAHATTPFVTAEHILECIEQVKGGAYDSAFCAKKLQTFFWKNGKPFNFELSNPPRTQDMEAYYTEVPTPYVFTKDTFTKYHARTGIKPYICEVSEIECVDIDYPDDFDLADAVYMKFFKEEASHE